MEKAARILGIKYPEINHKLVVESLFIKGNHICDLKQKLEESWAPDDTKNKEDK
ncbi:hypothetical protein [Proteocatella sphenisci]|uniref:hypothetical protein n=1 Tax=Proteocatella sphenisci TaxID=181070 RepID=UPI001469CE13|nr:hypothetical protein [Proteocatella sphenisci]